MNSRRIILIILPAVICIILFTLMGVSANSAEMAVREMLTARTDILENTLSGRITFAECREKLKEIEEGALLNKDCQSIIDYENSDYDRVKHMKITKVNQENKVADLITFNVSIEWTTLGYDGLEYIDGEYYVGVVQKGDSFRLVSMNPINY